MYSLRTHPVTQRIKCTAGRMLSQSVESFVFVATPGRTGTKTLAKLCTAVPNCAAFHEPRPNMNGSILNAYSQNQKNVVEKYFKNYKVPAIYKACLDKTNYVETSHIFIKCFSDLAVKEFGQRMKVIHLQRDRHAVARSWMRMSSVPGKGFQGPWLPDPYAPEHYIKYEDIIKHSPDFNHEYFKCLWYWYETEAQVLFFKKQFPHIPVLKLDTEDLSKAEIVIPLFT